VCKGAALEVPVCKGAALEVPVCKGAALEVPVCKGAALEVPVCKGAALEKKRNYTNFSNHTTSARITPSRICVLVLSVGGSVLISLICLNSRETGYGYRDRSHYIIPVAGLQKRRLDETSIINAGSKFRLL